jgi:predicted site-specific integrase-resolvase
MELSEWARRQGISYKAAWKWYKEGELPVPAYQTPTGTILVDVGEEKGGGKVAIYARVSSADQKADLDRQIARLLEFANSEGPAVAKTVMQIGSGLNGQT